MRGTPWYGEGMAWYSMAWHDAHKLNHHIHTCLRFQPNGVLTSIGMFFTGGPVGIIGGGGIGGGPIGGNWGTTLAHDFLSGTPFGALFAGRPVSGSTFCPLNLRPMAETRIPMQH